jgi:hemoglobin
MSDDVTTAYARIGGAPAVRAVVDRFYERLLADAELRVYFAGLGEEAMAGLRRHQAA